MKKTLWASERQANKRRKHLNLEKLAGQILLCSACWHTIQQYPSTEHQHKVITTIILFMILRCIVMNKLNLQVKPILIYLLCVFRPDLMRFVQELRSSSGGSLSNMALQDMVGGVTQLILDHQVVVVVVVVVVNHHIIQKTQALKTV